MFKLNDIMIVFYFETDLNINSETLQNPDRKQGYLH